METVIPEEGEKLIPVAPVNLDPLIVRPKEDPGAPCAGAIESIVGSSGCGPAELLVTWRRYMKLPPPSPV